MDEVEEYRVNQRLNISNEFCSVKFVGEIANWPSELALGLEWDNPGRGKNDGSIGNVRYFDTRKGLNSGSFIKASSKKLRGSTGVSFIRALCEKYGKGMSSYTSYEDLFKHSNEKTTLIKERDLNVKEIKIGTKVVESYGFEKLDQLQSNFQGLEVISLNLSNIANNKNDFNPNEDVKIYQIVPSLRILDLSFNLLSDLSEIMKILAMTTVENLNLSGNRLVNLNSITDIDQVPSVKKLLLAETYVKDLDFLCHCFPNLEELNLSANEIREPDFLIPLTHLKKLKVLDVSFNQFETVPYEILAQMTKLEKLVINNNCLSIKASSCVLKSIIELDVRANSISDWKEVDWLNIQLPNLQKLTINDNLITVPSSKSENSKENMNKIDATTIQIIARMSENLNSLNRTSISQGERENYELYFLSLLKKDSHNFESFMKTTRYTQLCKKYNIDADEILKGDNELSGRLSSAIISLNIKLGQDQSFKRKTFKYYSVGSLKGAISRLLCNKSILDFSIYYEISPGLREYLKDDLTMIQSTGVSDNENIYIEINQ